ncbi:hypothetical protein G7Y89_g218 [Cudoniella acicularis]|uniref:Uncharacterized protein n=1 Tax=Cudoniella acicularis TaxID=354080 RepID=A0A8H4RZ90_9HELO|nr:hypothetical protein G7Y89_g218 [Cudoniella acicularis]
MHSQLHVLALTITGLFSSLTTADFVLELPASIGYLDTALGALPAAASAPETAPLSPTSLSQATRRHSHHRQHLSL